MAQVQTNEKSTLRVALSWLGSHVMGVVLALIINLSLGSLIDNLALQIIVGIFSFFIYFMLMGGAAWQLGNQDRNRVKYRRREEDLLRGLKVGCLASIPLFLFGIALLLAKAELLPNFYVIYKLCNGYLLPFINLIDGTAFGVLAAYLTRVSWGAIVGVVCLNLVPAVICGVHYILGYKEIILMDNIIYKKKKK